MMFCAYCELCQARLSNSYCFVEYNLQVPYSGRKGPDEKIKMRLDLSQLSKRFSLGKCSYETDILLLLDTVNKKTLIS